MTKLEINKNQQSQIERMMQDTNDDAKLEALSAELEYLREKAIDLREDAAMNGECDEAELEMYDEAPAFSIYEE